MNKNKVSVLMTVYNTSKFLKKSIKSIINQTYKNFELIIIDDGSTDDSKKIIKNFRSKKIKKFFFKKNSGRIKAINFAIKKSSGNFIAILDSDDFSKKNRLKTQLDIFKKNKDLMLVGSLVDLVDEKNKKISTYPKIKDAQNFEQSIHLKNIFPFSSVVFKKKVLKKVSFYSKNIYYAIDFDFILRVKKYYKIFLLQKILGQNTLRSSNLSNDKKLFENRKLDEIKILKFSQKNFDLSKKIKTLIKIKILLEFFKILIYRLICFFKIVNLKNSRIN